MVIHVAKQVLHHFKNDNGILTLHVTDYTRNPRTHASQADWCPNGLSEYVLKIEVWDDEGTATWAEKARLEGKLSYCKLSNVKMRLSAGNYFEGKLRERKIIAFDEDSHDSRLKALLSRKAEFNKVHREAETEYEDRLLSDAIPEQFFNCVVEVLHVEIPDTSKTVFVYVTDYTRRLDLDLSNDEWAKNLKGMVVMVKLQDQQADRARLKIVKPGAYYQFRKLRLRARRLHGTLGGSQALIQQLGNNSPLVEDLLRRKREIQGKSSWLPNSRLGEIRSSTAKLPRKHRVYAKILGYQPKKLENAIYQWCSHCKKDVDWLRMRCFDCEAKPDFVSRLTLLIEDEAGDKAYVNVPLEAELFGGIDRHSLIGGGINLEFERRVNILTTPQDDLFHALVLVAWKDDNEALMLALENVKC
ncbi:hypothetical protein CC2G_005497 [Coprinopsis cinerea AmutBmut pab1-1]|nr:hypothetical protein CC2G_005497 [Coprinopsis cinerea AmutBmut pab1-1]